MSIYKKETSEEKVMRIITRVIALSIGLIILWVVAVTPANFTELTIDDGTGLRTAAMLGFMGWVFVLVSTIRPRK